jgi:hypothetical protein
MSSQSKIQTIISGTKLLAFLGVSAAAAYLGYRYVRADIAARVYEQRLGELALDYQNLAEVYNDAVRRTAVTELLVRGDELSVRVRTSEGTTRLIPTPFDPKGEIYVDFLVLDGRLWIRRVFDAKTPPGQGLVIDPSIAQIAWNADGTLRPEGEALDTIARAAVGKAVYRSLTEGVWAVTVSGDGSLGLTKLPDGHEARLVAKPEIKDYQQIQAEATEGISRLTAADLWREIAGGR